jgi:hypothetical protein
MCVVLINQQAKRMRRTILPTAASPTLQSFSILAHKRHDVRKKFTEHKTCVLISSTNLSEIFLILKGTERGIINVNRSSRKVPVILVRFS